MARTAWIALFVLLGLGGFTGCTSIPITPQALAAAAVDRAEPKEHLTRWQEAVWLCNEFLSSEFRHTLPPSRLRLTSDGMEYISANFTRPYRVRCTSWGDVLVAVNMAAQERGDGFVVGRVRLKGDRLVNNSFFLARNGSPNSNAAMASLILHELTHTHYQLGIVDFFSGLRYYTEAVVRLRYRNHSMERLPFQTSAEFERFFRAFAEQHAEPKVPASP